MFTSTYSALSEALKQIRRENPRQFAVAEMKDETGTLVWAYSRPVEFMKENK